MKPFLAGLALAAMAAPEYDPLAVSGKVQSPTLDLTVHDQSRGRDIPVLIYLPAEKRPAPVILFSHGLGGSRQGNAYLGNHWSARGYAVVFVQHPGSDTGVWQNVPSRDRMQAMGKAASPENFQLRVKDIPAVLDQLGRWAQSGDHPLSGRLDMERAGMSGHSFGAVTTQAVSGQTAGGRALFTDLRIKAAIAFSPSSPRRGDPVQAFGKVRIPWMLMTGTRDEALIGDTNVASRLAVYPALPPGGKYELVLHDGEHSAFSDRALPGDRGQRNPNHHRVILALSTAFWDAMLGGDTSARAWLDGDGPKSVLEPKDRWQKK
jgi:predicted dienelactone hydrolase